MDETVRRFLGKWHLHDVMAGILALGIFCGVLYLGYRVETQKTFYRGIIQAQLDRDAELSRVLYARLMLLRMMANKIGLTDQEIIASIGANVFDMPPPATISVEGL